MFVEKSHSLGTALALPGSRRGEPATPVRWRGSQLVSHFGSVMKWAKWDNQCRGWLLRGALYLSVCVAG